MSRTIALAVLVLAFVVLAGCGSGPGLDKTSGGGFAAALGLPHGLGSSSDGAYDGADEALDEAGNVLPADVAAASPLTLKLIGGETLRLDPVSGHRYYPMKVGETRPIRCTFSGTLVNNDPPVWKREFGDDGPLLFTALALPPVVLEGNFLAATFDISGARPVWVKVTYQGYTKRIWVWPQGTWSPVGQTATLNAAGARLKVTGSTSQWATQILDGFRLFAPKQSGELTLKGIIVPTDSYPGAPVPTWTANQNRLQFVGSSTGWNIKFLIKKSGDSYLTARIGNYAVTVLVSK